MTFTVSVQLMMATLRDWCRELCQWDFCAGSGVPAVHHARGRQRNRLQRNTLHFSCRIADGRRGCSGGWTCSSVVRAVLLPSGFCSPDVYLGRAHSKFGMSSANEPHPVQLLGLRVRTQRSAPSIRRPLTEWRHMILGTCRQPVTTKNPAHIAAGRALHSCRDVSLLAIPEILLVVATDVGAVLRLREDAAVQVLIFVLV